FTGPRSLMRTTTDRPLARFSTRTREPSGSVRCAAVSLSPSMTSPLAVAVVKSYQEARPVSGGLARSTTMSVGAAGDSSRAVCVLGFAAGSGLVVAVYGLALLWEARLRRLGLRVRRSEMLEGGDR